ncbi:DNA methylase N-4/N-6 [Nitrobacter hamburgensis X14]|uniref:Methyltransferase n=1 Tax=Nitrobacter hamburgensis (strain DSM 10229 / NCIMB 13809 / X14) TaxID=323097 RepID=Q1QQ16_NITHX|nr:DNA methyltransferase [Nitrobacter hamburgensis]ABE61681.1 DNA methylase N-4/N-6 [Nitrobacter hamburgensis X14]
MHNIQCIAVGSLKPNPRNVRTHSKRQISQIANSISRFGWTYPLLVDENLITLAGHGRLLAARQLGLEKIPVIVFGGLSDTEKRALMLADNKIAANAGWDRKILAKELGELSDLLPEINLDIEITGFSAAEIEPLLVDLVDGECDPADDAPLLAKEAITRKGDLWTLGDHRLICADACSRKAYQALMKDCFASVAIPDQPYNDSIVKIVGRGKIKHREFARASGELSPEQFVNFQRQWMELCSEFSKPGSIHFVFIDWRHLSEALTAGHAVYSELKNVAVWCKTNAGQGSFYRSQHELILVFKNGDAPHQNNIELGRHGRNRSNVWTYAGVNTFRAGRMDDLSVHPTVKPVGLVLDAIKDCSRRGDIVLDPFMGSGTTILAAERVDRRGFGIEIDPLYVDVAIRRWQQFTGQDAILEASGLTFHEIEAKRSTDGGGK